MIAKTISHLIDKHGTSFLWYKAVKCSACGTTNPGDPLFDCSICHGFGMSYSVALPVKGIFRHQMPRLSLMQAGYVEHQSGTTLLVQAQATIIESYKRDYLKAEVGKSVLRDKFVLDSETYLVMSPPKDIRYKNTILALRFNVEIEQR